MTTALMKAAKPKPAADLSALVGDLLAAKQHLERLLQHAETMLRKAPAGGHSLPRPSALDRVKEVVTATAQLRNADGNLSADRIARLYAVSLSRLAGWLGRTRQTVAKTPGADSLQEPLMFFERTARLTAVVSAGGFRKWLRTPNESLAGRRPLDLLAAGEGQVVADLVDDILTGAPG